MMIREESGRRPSLFDRNYMEGMCLDRRHTILTQSRQPVARFTPQEYTTSSSYTIYIDIIHVQGY